MIAALFVVEEEYDGVCDAVWVREKVWNAADKFTDGFVRILVETYHHPV